jgi:hypothetical protein
MHGNNALTAYVQEVAKCRSKMIIALLCAGSHPNNTWLSSHQSTKGGRAQARKFKRFKASRNSIFSGRLSLRDRSDAFGNKSVFPEIRLGVSTDAIQHRRALKALRR